MAMRFSLFKLPKHRVFDHKPLYYDSKKERKQELERAVNEARTGQYDSKNMESRMLRGFRAKLPGTEGLLRKESQDRRVRTVVIIIFLALIAFAIFKMG